MPTLEKEAKVLGKPKNDLEARKNPTKEFVLLKGQGKNRLKMSKGDTVYLTAELEGIYRKKELIK